MKGPFGSIELSMYLIITFDAIMSLSSKLIPFTISAQLMAMVIVTIIFEYYDKLGNLVIQCSNFRGFARKKTRRVTFL